MAPKIKLVRRRVMPSGFIVGRIDPGTGDEQLLKFSDLARALSQSGINPSGAVTQAGFGFYIEAVMTSNELIGSGVFGKDVTFPSSHVPSNVSALTAAAASAVFNIATNNGGGPVTRGTITFASGSTVGVVAWIGGTYTLPAGTTIYLYAPNPADTNLGWVTGLVEGDVH